MKKLIQIVVKIFIVLTLFIITVDIVGSYIIYRSYYNQELIYHPSLESVHSNYSVEYLDKSTHKMEDFKGKVKVLYWHSGCPTSKHWLPKLNRIAIENKESLELFIITNQAPKTLEDLTSAKNIYLCRGAGRVNEKVFKHSSSSHLVILDKNNSMKAYGYQLSESDSISKALVNNRKLSPSLSERLKLKENEFQLGLKNHNNFNFIVSGFDENRNFKAEGSVNWINYVNMPIGRIYQFIFNIPGYRIIDLTNENINCDSTINKYCVYYKKKTPFVPFIWQIIYDNKENRRKEFVADIQKRLDKEFGLKSDIILKTTPTLLLRKVIPDEKNKFKKLPRNGEFLYNVSSDSDTIRWKYNLKTDIWSIANAIEQVLEMPVQAEYKSSDMYHIVLSFLNNKKFTRDKIIEDLRKQGLSLDIKNREVKYLQIKKESTLLTSDL